MGNHLNSFLNSVPGGRAAEGSAALADVYMFPLSQFREDAPAPLAFRSVVDVAEEDLPVGDPLEVAVLEYPAALALEAAQDDDGVWSNSIVETFKAYRQLLEYGWSEDMPALALTRRLFFKLLSAADEPELYFEFKGRADSHNREYYRNLVREIASAGLAIGGYGEDPRLRGAVRKTIDRVKAFFAALDEGRAWKKIGSRAVICLERTRDSGGGAGESFVSPPSVYTLVTLAHMPDFRTENRAFVRRLLAYLSAAPVTSSPALHVGREIIDAPYIVDGDPFARPGFELNFTLDPHRDALPSAHAHAHAHADAHAGAQAGGITYGSRNIGLDNTLFWLEVLARLEVLDSNPAWMDKFYRAIEVVEAGSPQKAGTGPEADAGPEAVSGLYTADMMHEVTFRLGLIARLLGWNIKSI